MVILKSGLVAGNWWQPHSSAACTVCKRWRGGKQSTFSTRQGGVQESWEWWRAAGILWPSRNTHGIALIPPLKPKLGFNTQNFPLLSAQRWKTGEQSIVLTAQFSNISLISHKKHSPPPRLSTEFISQMGFNRKRLKVQGERERERERPCKRHFLECRAIYLFYRAHPHGSGRDTVTRHNAKSWERAEPGQTEPFICFVFKESKIDFRNDSSRLRALKQNRICVFQYVPAWLHCTTVSEHSLHRAQPPELTYRHLPEVWGSLK